MVFDADPLDAATMQAIAREMNHLETVFVVRSAVADVGARYFREWLQSASQSGSMR